MTLLIGYVFCFLLGQWLFLLRRIALAVRSPMNALKSRRQYLKQNWDILVVRGGIEFGFLFFYLHQPMIEQFIGQWHLRLPFTIPVFSFGCFSLGFLCDAAMDTLGMRERIFGITVPFWIRETVPQLPEIQELVAQLAQEKNAQ